MDIPTLVVLVVGGVAVIASYVFVFRRVSSGYLSPSNPYWLGYSAPTIKALVILQLLAVAGFFMFAVPWVFMESPQGGSLAHEAALPVILGLFMIAAALWAPFMQKAVNSPTAAGSTPWKAAGAAALFVCAAASVLLVAMAAEETNPRWYVLLGTVLFAATTVLGDGIAYPARMLTRDIRANA